MRISNKKRETSIEKIKECTISNESFLNNTNNNNNNNGNVNEYSWGTL